MDGACQLRPRRQSEMRPTIGLSKICAQQVRTYYRLARDSALFVSCVTLLCVLGVPLALAQDDHGDNAASATELPFGARVAGRINSRTDSDYFRLTVDTPTRVTVFSEGAADVYGEFRDADGRILDRSTSTLVDDENQTPFQLRFQEFLFPGIYYLRIASNGSTRGAYTVVAEAESPLDLASGARLSAEINPAGQSDYFRLTVRNPLSVTVRSEGSDIDVDASIYDEDGSFLAFDFDSGEGTNFQIEQFLFSGTYYVEVYATSLSTTGAYTIATDVRSARHVELPTRVDGEISRAGEKDWYRLALDTRTYVTLQTEIAGNVAHGTYGQLYDSTGARVAYDDDLGGNAQFRIEVLLPTGVYYLRVSFENANSTGEYVLVAGRPPQPRTALPLGARVHGTMRGPGLRDYYDLRVETAAI